MKPRLMVAQVCAALNAEGANYLVIGGIACILHGYVRATTDVGSLVERTKDNVERVLAALANTGYGFATGWTGDQVLESPVTIIGLDTADIEALEEIRRFRGTEG